jgi:hypothetical protein
MTATIISITISAIAVITAVIGLLRLYSRDGRGAVKDLSRIETKVDSVGDNIKEIRDDVKAQGIRQIDFGERLVAVEESTKSAHHRIDGLEEKNK